MKTRRNLYVEDSFWQQVCGRAKAEKRSAANLIEYYIDQGLNGTKDHSELVTLLLIELREAWKQINGLYSEVDGDRLEVLIKEFENTNK